MTLPTADEQDQLFRLLGRLYGKFKACIIVKDDRTVAGRLHILDRQAVRIAEGCVIVAKAGYTAGILLEEGDLRGGGILPHGLSVIVDVRLYPIQVA